jgi:uncharacterized membrane protein
MALLTRSARNTGGWLVRNWPLAVFAVVHVLIFTLFFKSGWIFGKFLQDDFTLSYYYSSKIMLGHLPYRDFAVEYPPLALVFMLLPRLFSASPEVYANLFNAEMLLFDLAGLFIVAAIARRLDRSLWKTLLVYTLAVAALGPIAVVRYDIIPAFFLLLALFLFIRGHCTWSWAVLGVGALTKIFPLVVLPLLLIYHFRRRQYREIARGAGAFVLAAAIISLPFIVISAGGFVDSFIYHTGRSLQCETTYASFLLLAKALGWGSLQTVISSGSVNVISPLADALSTWSTLIMLAALLAVYWLYYRRSPSMPGANVGAGPGALETAGLVNFFFLAVLVFVLTYKVFSPQYMIWFFPLVPLLTTRSRNLHWMIFVLAALMTAFVYPKDYGGLEYGEWLAIAMLVTRNLALILLAFMVASFRPTTPSSAAAGKGR